jgi:hypothetical protein
MRSRLRTTTSLNTFWGDVSLGLGCLEPCKTRPFHPRRWVQESHQTRGGRPQPELYELGFRNRFSAFVWNVRDTLVAYLAFG